MKKSIWTSMCSILFVAVLLAMAAGCGKKAGAPAAVQPDKPSGPSVADVQAWTLAKAWLKDSGKTKSEYVGKEVILRNMLAYQSVSDTHVVNSCAYDPQSKTISSQGASRYQGKDLVSGDEFDFVIEFADAAEFENIKDSSGGNEDDKAFAVYETLFSVKGVIFDDGVDNGLVVKKARLVK